MLFTFPECALGVTGSVFGGPAHAVSFNKIVYDTVSYRVALKGICFQLQMVVKGSCRNSDGGQKP